MRLLRLCIHTSVLLVFGCSNQNALITEAAIELSVTETIAEASRDVGPLVFGIVFTGSGDDRQALEPAYSFLLPTEELIFYPTAYACFNGEGVVASEWTSVGELSEWRDVEGSVIGYAGILTSTFGFDQDPTCETITVRAEAWQLPDGVSCQDPEIIDIPFDTETHQLVARSAERALGEEERSCYTQATTENPPIAPVVEFTISAEDMLGRL